MPRHYNSYLGAFLNGRLLFQCSAYIFHFLPLIFLYDFLSSGAWVLQKGLARVGPTVSLSTSSASGSSLDGLSAVPTALAAQASSFPQELEILWTGEILHLTTVFPHQSGSEVPHGYHVAILSAEDKSMVRATLRDYKKSNNQR